MSAQNIQVVPIDRPRKKSNSAAVIECNEKRREITAFDRNSSISSTKTFTFDKVFGVESRQIDVYNQVVRPVVMEVIEGYNCTIFAYGQTGTGKTFTMEGGHSPNSEEISWEDDPLVGIIPRSVAHLFSSLKSMQNCEHSVKVSFIELYNEELTDLLSEQSIEKDEKLKIYDDPSRKGSVMISKLEEVIVQNKNQVYKILQKGADRRQKASTLMNSQSSRSHSIFTVTVFIKEKTIEGEETIKVGKLNLVDLAGSENIERSGATGKRAAEAGKINKSLTTLGRVITALVEHRDHIPYRESNLTRLLQDSLGGKTKTTIIATISPAHCNLEETLSTLDYAHKAKSIRNKPEINQKLVKKALIKEYTEEIERLKRELYSTREKNGIYMPIDIHQEMESKMNMQKEEIRELLQKIGALGDELEKLNDFSKESKQTLEEKCESLQNAELKLCQAREKVEQVQQEAEETKFVLEHRAKTEAELYEQARQLMSVSTEADNDCKSLHDKIERISFVNEKNRCLANGFARFLNEKIGVFNHNGSELSGSSKQRLCCLCELLNEIKIKLKETKEDEIEKLHLFEDKQSNWISTQQSLLEKEFESSLRDYYEIISNTLAGQHYNLENSFESSMEVCNEHNESFGKIWSKLSQSIELAGKSFVGLETNMCDLTNKIFVANLQNSTEQADKTLAKISLLDDALEIVKSDVKELVEFKQSMESSFTESFKSIQMTMSSLESKMNGLFKSFDKKCANIEARNEQNASNITELREFVKEDFQIMAKKLKSQLEENINIPIKNLVETNSKNIAELNALSKSLNENHEMANSHYVNSLQKFIQIEDQNNSNLTKIVSTQFHNLERSSKKIQSNLDVYKTETSKYLKKFIHRSVEVETSSLCEMVDESISLASQTKQSNESLNEMTREFYTESTKALSEFAEKEFTEYIPTGQTPKSRTYNYQIDLPTIKSNEELLESFRNLNPRASDEFKHPYQVPIFNLSLNSSSSSLSINSTSMPDLSRSSKASGDVFSNQPSTSKRAIGNLSDKENGSDSNEKATKCIRSNSTYIRSGTTLRKQAFQDRN